MLAHQVQRSHGSEGALFDVNITLELRQVRSKDLSTTIERLTNVIGPTLARDQASFHVNVEPAVSSLVLQSRPGQSNCKQSESLGIEFDSGSKEDKVPSVSNSETLDPAA